jgi:Protein of unknown function (DUF2946)
MVMRPAGASHPRLRGPALRPLCYIRGVHAFRHHLQRLTWIALVAIFGLALAPAVSHALHADDVSNPFAEICSTNGAQAAPGTSDDAAPGMGHLQHCPLCGQASHALGMPPARAGAVAPALRTAAVAPPRERAPLSPRSCPAAQPRAPPTAA